MNNLFKILFSLLVLTFGCSTDKPVIVVSVEGGKVEGVAENNITVFKGIPFAKPPVGNLRWKAPQPVKKWEGVLKADKYAPACPQMKLKYAGFVPPPTSEDCLYLNITVSLLKFLQKPQSKLHFCWIQTVAFRHDRAVFFCHTLLS